MLRYPDVQTLAAEDGLENHINSDAAATIKQDPDGGGGENGVMEQKTLSRREVLSSLSKVDKPPGLLGPTTLKYESLLQKLIKAGREWVEHLQDELAKHPKKDGIGDLSIVSSDFRPGWMVDGQQPVMALPRMGLTSPALHYRINAVEKAHRRVTRTLKRVTRAEERQVADREQDVDQKKADILKLKHITEIKEVDVEVWNKKI